MTALDEADLAAWTEEQAASLRQLAADHPELADRLDLPHLTEAVACLGASMERELINRLARVLVCQARWRWQPGLRDRAWRNIAEDQRDQVALLLDENPSPRSRPGQVLNKAWALARKKAHRETGLELATFPLECPFTLDEVLAEGWLPD